MKYSSDAEVLSTIYHKKMTSFDGLSSSFRTNTYDFRVNLRYVRPFPYIWAAIACP